MAHLNKTLKPGDHADIAEERKKATFDTHKLAAVIFDSDENAKRKREITEAVAKRPELLDSKPYPFMNREEKINEVARKVTLLTKHMDELAEASNPFEQFHLNNEVIGIEGQPLALHGVMFIPALAAQADDEQQEKWLTRAMNKEIIGTYAQTELGHGTNLQRLETTATFDRTTDEFVLNSPTTTALKWWPGNLGKSSNHAVVVATLIIDGKKMGPHTFFVQLRDEKTHKPFPRITVGEIGPKMAYNVTDNGFLGFDHHRIPRTNMLMRHSKVDRQGNYSKPAHSKIGYSAMVHVRSFMIGHQGYFAAQALTVAIRYSSVRRQGFIDPKQQEVKVLDYQTQQHRLFPGLARAFAFTFAGQETLHLYHKVLDGIKHGETQLMADLHALTSGLKSVVTHQTGQVIEQARMSCGGHGYSMASYISEIYGVAIGGCTYEGENMVMLLQLARYLVKSVAAAQKRAQLGPLVEYLGRSNGKTSLIDRSATAGPQDYIAVFEHVAREQAFEAAAKFQSLLKSGVPAGEAWNKSAVELTRASRLHTRLFIAAAFVRKVHSVIDHNVKQVLTDLLNLHLNYELLEISHYAIQDGFLNKSQIAYIKDQLYFYLEKIRPNAVSLVDSWQFSDTELRSVLGRSDGHVYDNLFKWAKASQLNRSDVLPFVTNHLQPMMKEAAVNSKL